MTEIFPAEDARRARIMEGAMRVFLAYGYQRTTMDDIARAAEISRPALYLLFRNKADIYRALAQQFCDRAIATAQEAIVRDAPIADKLAGSMGCMLDMVDEIEESPHGADILDMKNSLAGDILATGRERMGELIGRAIAEEAARRGAGGGDADLLTDMLLDAIDGMKERGLPRERQRELVAFYIRTVAGAVGR